jgi:WhiB family redox-sensing transcriptional regulator
MTGSAHLKRRGPTAGSTGTTPNGTLRDQWAPKGLCVGADPELFFSQDLERGEYKAVREATAKSWCADCPVRRPCAEWAEVHNEDGVWGGTTTAERQRARRRKQEAAAKARAAAAVSAPRGPGTPSAPPR